MLLDDIRSIKSARKDLRNFGLTVGIALGVISGMLWWWEKPPYPYFLAVGVTLVMLGLAVPQLLKPLQKAWMTLAVILGWVMTRVILFAFFYFAFTLVGLIGRIFGKQFLSIKGKVDKSSQWNYRRQEPYDKRRTEMQF